MPQSSSDGTQRLRQRAASLVLLVVLLLLWQFLADSVVGTQWISSPVLVGRRLITIIGDGSLAIDAALTMQETVIGLALGVILGAAAGVLLSRAPRTAALLDPYLMGLNSLPRVALAPFFILWFGIGLASKVVLVISIVFFVALLNVRQGMQSIDHDLVDAVRTMGAGRRGMIRYVVLPSLLPWIVSTIKISIGMALIGAVVGEMIGAAHGLGWLVTSSLQLFDMTGAMTALVVMAALAMILFHIVGLIERHLFRWRTGAEGARTIGM
jgi:NitT/TauT family transport system permease protein